MSKDNKSNPFYGDDDNYDDDACRLPKLPPLAELEIGRMVVEPPAWAAENKSIIEKLKLPGRVALTGGIGAGKSLVAGMLVELGAWQIDFDGLSRRAVEPGTDGFSAVEELLGPRVINNGTLDRGKIASLIYADHEIRKKLEDIIHPRVWLLMGDELDKADGDKLAVISIPLLFEAGLETFFNPIIMVYAEPEVRLQRLLARNNQLSESLARRIMAAQWPDPPKIMGANYIINNSCSIGHTRDQVGRLYEELEAVLAARNS